jgi:hypothetical protein
MEVMSARFAIELGSSRSEVKGDRFVLPQHRSIEANSDKVEAGLLGKRAVPLSTAGAMPSDMMLVLMT